MSRWLMAALALVLAASLHGATFTLCSQNTLHLGYSSSNDYKVTQLRNEFATCDLTVLQEVMRRALDPPPPPAPHVPANLPNGALRSVTPAPGLGYTWNVPYTEIIGKTSYKESYSFIVNSNLVIYNQIFFPSPGTANRFARKPAAIILQTGADWTWIVDLHAIWGKSQSQREAEVRDMAKVVDELSKVDFGGTKYNRIIVGGDWNLDANNSAYGPLKTLGFTINPNNKTSLTTKGDPSSPYDHFAWSNTVTVTNPQVIVPANTQNWRKFVSDHMGIRCSVDY
jgi:endonuclease/exonuclease/phosphatase family metal-dependent hydrolase